MSLAELSKADGAKARQNGIRLDGNHRGRLRCQQQCFHSLKAPYSGRKLSPTWARPSTWLVRRLGRLKRLPRKSLLPASLNLRWQVNVIRRYYATVPWRPLDC